jgi:hypothetical protein
MSQGEIFYIDDLTPTKLRPKLSPRNLLLTGIVVAAAFGLAAVVLKARAYLTEVSHAYQCDLNLRQIGIAFNKYNDAHGSFPPAVLYDSKGKALHSWRALILPYLGDGHYAKLYHYDEPWNGPNNSKLTSLVIPEYGCPNNHNALVKGLTSYVAVIGSPTIFPPNGGTMITKDIRDGLNDTVMIVESSNAAIPWMEPRDLNWDSMSFKINDPTKPGISSRDVEGPHVLKANGNVSTFRTAPTPEILHGMLTTSGREVMDPF